MFKRLFKQFRYGEKGFTLIELLVVIAILGVLAAVAVPNISRFIGQGKSEANATELATIQSAVIAMMAEQKQATLSGGTGSSINTPASVTCGTANLGQFLVASSVNTDGTFKSGNSYVFSVDGSVAPPP